MLISEIYNEEKHSNFIMYCSEVGIKEIEELEKIDFIAFKNSIYGSEEEKNEVKIIWERFMNGKNFEKEEIVETNVVEKNNSNIELEKLIHKIEEYREQYGAPIFTYEIKEKWEGLSRKENKIIEENKDFFYFCTSRIFLLNKWIIEEIENIFIENNYIDIEILNLYIMLSEKFRVKNFNRKKLENLLKMNNILKYDEFNKYRRYYLSEDEKYQNQYNNVMNKSQKNVREQKDILKEQNTLEKLINKMHRILEKLHSFKNLVRNGRNKEILKYRTRGNTFESIGQKYDLSRERVRQIENKFIRKFNLYIFREKPLEIIAKFMFKNTLISRQDIFSIITQDYEVFIHYLKKYETSKWLWIDEIESFIIRDIDFYRKLKNEIDKLPETLIENEYKNEIKKLYSIYKNTFSKEEISKIVESNYNKFGNVYTKEKLNLQLIYHTVIEKYYPEGIKLYDDFTIKRLRMNIKEIFGDIKIPQNDRAINARIATLTVLCDRGKYILPDKIEISKELLEKIKSYIDDNPRNIILFAELYEVFKEELSKKSNINNRYFLQGVLKYYYSDVYYFSKDTIVKDKNSTDSIRDAIEEFILNENRLVNKDEIKEEFIGISDITIQSAVNSAKEILMWDMAQYKHSSLLKITESEKERIKSIIEENIFNGFITSRKISDILYLKEPDFMTKNEIFSHISAHSILSYLYQEEFDFKRPFICKKGIDLLSKKEILQTYFEDYDKINITELKEYLEENQIKILTFDSIIEELEKYFLRINQENFIKDYKINISEKTIELVENNIEREIIADEFIAINKITSFFYYPEVNYEWNPYMLESFMRKYSKNYKIIEYEYKDYRYINSFITNKKSNINSYKELVLYLLKKENDISNFRDIKEIEIWLLTKGLIINKIPEFLINENYIKFNEDNRIGLNY